MLKYIKTFVISRNRRTFVLTKTNNNLNLNIMNTEKIYKLSNELKNNINLFNELKNNLNERDIKTFNSLISLGDSEYLALATALENSLSDEEYQEKYNFYNNAYTN